MEIEQILKLVEAVSASPLTNFQYEGNGVKLKLERPAGDVAMAADRQLLQGVESVPQAKDGQELQAAAQKAETASAKESLKEGNMVLSPLVGTFYAAPAENAAPFVKVGDHVKKGQTLAIVEAMKLMNEIESEYDGVVTAVLAQNGNMVEYGMPLFSIA